MENCSCNPYENKALRESLGETLRPGGFGITKRALGLTDLGEDSRVLDIGSGMGDTVSFLQAECGMLAVGLEPSQLLMSEAEARHPGISMIQGSGESIPAGDGCFDGAFAECTLSLMDDLDKVIGECSRVLRSGGWLVISDVYARRPEHLQKLQEFSFRSCLRGMLRLDELEGKLVSAGFEVEVIEDHTESLRQLTVKLIFEYGSMAAFWNRMSDCSADMDEFRHLLSLCKAGYFMMVCRKK